MTNQVATLSLLAIIALMEPHSAIGAVFGCCFYLAMPHTNTVRQVILYTIASAGIGYSAGTTVFANEMQMLVSAITSATCVAVLTSAHGLIRERLMDLFNLLINLRK